MSSDCRQFRTSFMTRSHKLLIVQGCATVSEGRQGRQEVTPPNNKAQGPKLKAVSAVLPIVTRIVAHKGSRQERCLLVERVVHLRHYIGAIARLIIELCERVNGK